MTQLLSKTEPRTHTLDVPGATLRYDVREAEADRARRCC